MTKWDLKIKKYKKVVLRRKGGIEEIYSLDNIQGDSEIMG